MPSTTPPAPPLSSESDPPPGEASSAQHAAGLRRLSALLTHRLSTLTSTISGYADLIMDAPPPQEQRQMAMNVLETSAEIDDLLEDLRYYSHPLRPAFRAASAPALAQRAVALLGEHDQKRVQLDIGAHPGELRADPQMLCQALLGLLQNALEATGPEGAVRLHVAEAGPGEGDATARFEVRNEGVIPLDDPERIFRPFFTTHARRLGLGLPIARQIAESHGGTLRLAADVPSQDETCLTLFI